MSEYVWWVAGFSNDVDARAQYGWSFPDLSEDDGQKRTKDILEGYYNRLDVGEEPDLTVLPPHALWLGNSRELRAVKKIEADQGAAFKRLPNIHGGSYLFVANEALKMFQKANLPELQILDHPMMDENGSVINEPSAMLVPRAWKNTIDVAESIMFQKQSKRYRGRKVDWPLTATPTRAQNDEIVASKDALDGADVWVEQFYNGTIFVSQQFRDQIDQAGLIGEFDLRRVIVV